MGNAANTCVFDLAGSQSQDLAKQASYDQGEMKRGAMGQRDTGGPWLRYHVSTRGGKGDAETRD